MLQQFSISCLHVASCSRELHKKSKERDLLARSVLCSLRVIHSRRMPGQRLSTPLPSFLFCVMCCGMVCIAWRAFPFYVDSALRSSILGGGYAACILKSPCGCSIGRRFTTGLEFGPELGLVSKDDVPYG